MTITALLGPTNTGKTYRATQRMLEYATGMIGVPLRLLAREIYDAVSARVGEEAVALVTGEETRVPPRPSYWVSTVEAMPVEREVDFLAVDEVQLASHEQRGHVFTSRLLSARGREETWFLGAETMRGALAELVPTARVVEHPRLSLLTFAGSAPLARLPPRSAVVAFSMPHVYEMAERLRARKGGAAVVLGALSPRTRNAQVAMFQAGEVDYLVATDAVGMGLNLDCVHVAFASLRKFDGNDVRALSDPELAQIAGRAGRWIENGTFGTVLPLELPAASVRAIEEHRFEPVRRVRWRNDDLDFTSVEALLASLDVKPTRAILRGVGSAEDRAALGKLARRDDVLHLARGEERVRLLWDVCTVPDFRKLLLEVHVEFLAELYAELVRVERLSDDWISARVRDLDDTSGDVEVLMARIAAVRTWTYVTNRSPWVASPRAWQETTRALEDRLSEALHARLVSRFVDARRGRARHPAPRPRTNAARAARVGEGAGEGDAPLVVDAHHPFAKLARVAARGAVVAAPGSAPGPPSGWVEAVVDAPHEALRLEASGGIVHAPTGRAVGAIVRGAKIAAPDVRLLNADDLGAGARSRLQRRVLAFARDVASDLLGGLGPLAKRTTSAPLRGLVHRLELGLGTARAADVTDLLEALSPEDRASLDEAGLVLGGAVLYVARGLGAAERTARVALASVHFGARAEALAAARGSAASFPAPRGMDPRVLVAVGYPAFGGRAVRADVAERVARKLRDGEEGEEGWVASWVGCSAREAVRVGRELGS